MQALFRGFYESYFHSHYCLHTTFLIPRNASKCQPPRTTSAKLVKPPPSICRPLSVNFLPPQPTSPGRISGVRCHLLSSTTTPSVPNKPNRAKNPILNTISPVLFMVSLNGTTLKVNFFVRVYFVFTSFSGFYFLSLNFAKFFAGLVAYTK
jgi:hypothetical protein